MKTYNIHQINQKIKEKPIKNKDEYLTSFEEVLSSIEDVNFSKHARKRIEDRKIDIKKSDIHRINKAISDARIKGIKRALIIMDNKAFIAGIEKKTIITTIDKESIRDNIFTNIDGAVII